MKSRRSVRSGPGFMIGSPGGGPRPRSFGHSWLTATVTRRGANSRATFWVWIVLNRGDFHHRAGEPQLASAALALWRARRHRQSRQSRSTAARVRRIAAQRSVRTGERPDGNRPRLPQSPTTTSTSDSLQHGIRRMTRWWGALGVSRDLINQLIPVEKLRSWPIPSRITERAPGSARTSDDPGSQRFVDLGNSPASFLRTFPCPASSSSAAASNHELIEVMRVPPVDQFERDVRGHRLNAELRFTVIAARRSRTRVGSVRQS